MASRLTAALLVFALFGLGVSPCSGWESTAKARHDCCHRHSGGHSGPISQAEADQCCATSERQTQQRAAQFAGPAFLLLPLLESVVVAAADITPPDRTDPATVPVPSPQARLHLLFSVFLV